MAIEYIHIGLPNIEKLDRYLLSYDNWHKKWEACALLTGTGETAGASWYKGMGITIEAANAELTQNILSGKTTADLVRAQISKGRAVIEKKKQERLKTATPLEDLF